MIRVGILTSKRSIFSVCVCVLHQHSAFENESRHQLCCREGTTKFLFNCDVHFGGRNVRWLQIDEGLLLNLKIRKQFGV